MQTLSVVIFAALAVVLILVASGVRMVQQYQKGIVLRFGRLLPRVREPGLQFIVRSSTG